MSINFELTDPNAAASQVLVESQRVRRAVGSGIIPHQIFVTGQYNSDKTTIVPLTKYRVDSIGKANNLFGRGSQLALTLAKVFATKGAVPVDVYPLADDGSAVKAAGQIAVTGTATSNGRLRFRIGGQVFDVVVLADDTATEVATKIRDAILAKPDLPVEPTLVVSDVDLDCKWSGESGNGIRISVNRETQEQELAPEGITISLTQLSGGLVDPDIMPALQAVGDTWYTVYVNPYTNGDARDALRARWIETNDPQVNKVFTSCEGYTGNKADLITLASGLNAIGVSIYPVALSESIPCEVAGSVAGVIARYSQIDPGRPFNGLELVGIDPAQEIWDITDRNDVVLAGASTTTTDEFGVVMLEDAVTTFKQDPDGTLTHAWRFVEAITNVQVKRYQLFVAFSQPPYNRGVIVDDASTTSKGYAVRPRSVKSTLFSLARVWVAEAWSKNLDAILASVDAVIDSSNPNRINAVIGDVLVAGGKVWAIKHEWDFVPPSVD